MSEQATRFEVKTKYGLEEYRIIARAQTNLTQKRLLVGYLTSGFLFAMVFFYVLIRSFGNLLGNIHWLILFGLLAYVILSTGLHMDRTVAKKLWRKNHKYVSEVTYIFFSDHMEADNPKDMRLDYCSVHAVRETDHYFLIYASENAVNVISKDGFKKGNMDSFRTFIAEATNKEIEYYN